MPGPRLCSILPRWVLPPWGLEEVTGLLGQVGLWGSLGQAKPLLPPFSGLELAQSLFWVRNLDLAVSLVPSLVLVTGTIEPEAPRDKVTQEAVWVAAILSLRGPCHGGQMPELWACFILLPSNYTSRACTR